MPLGVIAQEFWKVDPQDGKKMTKEQFSKGLTRLRKMTIMGQKQTNKGKMLDARKITAKEEDFQTTNDEISSNLFASKEFITLRDFIEFREQLKTALRHYEFH
jgi:hypothetical protein